MGPAGNRSTFAFRWHWGSRLTRGLGSVKIPAGGAGSLRASVGERQFLPVTRRARCGAVNGESRVVEQVAPQSHLLGGRRIVGRNLRLREARGTRRRYGGAAAVSIHTRQANTAATFTPPRSGFAPRWSDASPASWPHRPLRAY